MRAAPSSSYACRVMAACAKAGEAARIAPPRWAQVIGSSGMYTPTCNHMEMPDSSYLAIQQLSPHLSARSRGIGSINQMQAASNRGCGSRDGHSFCCTYGRRCKLLELRQGLMKAMDRAKQTSCCNLACVVLARSAMARGESKAAQGRQSGAGPGTREAPSACG